MFRGWSRLCLHAASVSAAEGASAAATAVARAARAEAKEKEAAAAVGKAEAWRRAAAASAEVAEAREKAQREAARGSVLATELDQKDEETERVVRQQKLRRMKFLVRGCQGTRYVCKGPARGVRVLVAGRMGARTYPPSKVSMFLLLVSL